MTESSALPFDPETYPYRVGDRVLAHANNDEGKPRRLWEPATVTRVLQRRAWTERARGIEVRLDGEIGRLVWKARRSLRPIELGAPLHIDGRIQENRRRWSSEGRTYLKRALMLGKQRAEGRPDLPREATKRTWKRKERRILQRVTGGAA